MSGTSPEREDAELGSALRRALNERDRALRAPRFAGLWPDPNATRPRSQGFAWRPALAAAIAVGVVGVVAWTGIARFSDPDAAAAGGRLDPTLARELSSPEYWRVPTDALLAYTAPPLSAELPSAEGFQVSLEESFL